MEEMALEMVLLISLPLLSVSLNQMKGKQPKISAIVSSPTLECDSLTPLTYTMLEDQSTLPGACLSWALRPRCAGWCQLVAVLGLTVLLESEQSWHFPP